MSERAEAGRKLHLPRLYNDEAAVMVVERRGRSSRLMWAQLVRRKEPFVRWKAAAFARWHEPDEARVSSLESVSGLG